MHRNLKSKQPLQCFDPEGSSSGQYTITKQTEQQNAHYQFIYKINKNSNPSWCLTAANQTLAVMVPRASSTPLGMVNHCARRWSRGIAWNGISILYRTASPRTESFINLKSDSCAVCLSFSFLSVFSIVECMRTLLQFIYIYNVTDGFKTSGPF